MRITPFDPAAYLDTPETLAAFLGDALESSDAAYIQDAFAIAARALMRKLEDDPKLSTLLAMFDALGLKLSAAPKRSEDLARDAGKAP